MATHILLAALAAFFLTTFVKYFVTFNMLPTLKLLIVSVLSLGGILVLRFEQGWEDVLFSWLAACALAMFIHGLHKLIQAAGDERRVATLHARSRGR
ncbi:MAG: hypothetical protein ABR616_15630 [Dermatophilaceae bacterium]